MLGASFQRFLIEALLASASLRGRLTAINKCKYHDKGSFYNAFPIIDRAGAIFESFMLFNI